MSARAGPGDELNTQRPTRREASTVSNERQYWQRRIRIGNTSFRNKKYSRSFSFGIRLCLNLPLVPDSDSDTTHVLALPEQPPPAGRASLVLGWPLASVSTLPSFWLRARHPL